jgi:hypothetical protein
MKRREFIKNGLHAVSVLSVAKFSVANAAVVKNKSGPSELSAFLDTLIPEDSTPSASQLGLEQKLVDLANGIENYPKLLSLGVEWLNLQSEASYKRKFTNLTNNQMISVVQLAENSPSNSISNLFFNRVRTDLFGLYYAEPSSMVGLAINTSPQPNGYMNYTKPFHSTLHD